MTAPTGAGDLTGLTPRLLYRILAIAETITWSLLILAILLKYVAQIDTPFTFAAGLVHGFVFIAYAGTAIIVGLNQRWSLGLIAAGIVTAIVPYATIPFDRWLERNDRTAGGWRTTETDDPRDKNWIDRSLRWMLAHPALLGTTLVTDVVVIVTVLLILGPPNEW